MIVGKVNWRSLIKRADVKYNLSSVGERKSEIWRLEELKETIVRDPMCYGFQYCQKGIPLIRISDLRQPFIDFSNVAFINEETHNKFSKTHLQKYDILMSVRGVSIGKIGIYMGEFKQANISPNIIIIRLKDKKIAQYVTMVLLSEFGQEQIKRSIAGSSKPTITAPLINAIQIPRPDDGLLNKINGLFEMAYNCKTKAIRSITIIEKYFEKIFYIEKAQQRLAYTRNIRDDFRWDPHYHNPKYERLRIGLSEKKCEKLIDICPLVTTCIDKEYEDEIGYIEISDVNNVTGKIEGMKKDYIKRLPKGSKVILKDGDLLISKVRPYRNANTMFRDNGKNITTASKNGFAVLRTLEYSFPYFILAFLRSYYGMNQIVMSQSGTSYPTVSEEDIAEIKIPILKNKQIFNINTLYKFYLDSKDIELENVSAILELLSCY